MRVVIGPDHPGYSWKADLVTTIKSLGHEVLDLGTHGAETGGYSDCAEAVGGAIVNEEADRGVLLCGSGVGASVAANKLPGIRAGLCHDTCSAHQGVEHDDRNLLVLGARVIGQELARDLVRTFLDASFSGEQRHRRRLEKVKLLIFGGLWNSLIVLGRLPALLESFQKTLPELWERFQRIAGALRDAREGSMLEDVYRGMPVAKFSRHVLQRIPQGLGVVPVTRDLSSDWKKRERMCETPAEAKAGEAEEVLSRIQRRYRPWEVAA